MKLRLKYTGFFVSFFLLFALAFVFISIYMLTANKRIFADKVLFHTTFENSNGLTEGAPVFMKGFKVGYIDNFYLDKSNNVKTDIFIYKEYVTKIATRSIITKSVHPITSVSNIEIILLPEGIITPSDYYFIFSSDSYYGKLILTQNNLVSSGSDQLSYIINNLNSMLLDINRMIASDSIKGKNNIFNFFERTVTILEQTESLLKMLNGTENRQGELIKAFRNFSKTSEEMIKTSQLMNKTLFLTDSVMGNFKNPDELLVKMLDPTKENIFNPTNKVLINLQSLLNEHEKLAVYLNSKTSDISILIQKLNQTINKLNITLDGINNNPILGIGNSEQNVRPPLIYFPIK